MQGQSECLSENETVPFAFEYKWLTDEITPLKNPVGENITCDMKNGYTFTKDTIHKEWIDIHVAGSSCYGNTNLVPSFCRAYTSLTKREVVAVHVAKGSTEISYWLKGNVGYDVLIQKSNAAINKIVPERIFFVWLQGESDAINGRTKEYYKNNLKKLCDDLKKDVCISKFGIIRVGRFTNSPSDDEIILAQDEICKDDPDFIMLTDIATTLNGIPEYMNPFVRGHYSAKGLEKLGTEAGKVLATL